MSPVLLIRKVKQQWVEITENTGLDHASVTVPWQEHGLSRTCHRQQGGLKQSGGSVDAIPAMVNTHGLRCSPLAVANGAFRLQRSADAGQLWKIPEARPPAQQLAQFSR